MIAPRHWLTRLSIALLACGLLLGAAEAARAAGTVLATGLANPRGIVVGADGTLYVAEAGLSGSEPFAPPAPYPPSTRGTSGRLSRIAPDGTKTTVAADLPSLSLGGNGNPFVLGPAGLTMDGATIWLANGAMLNAHPPAANAATLLRIDTRSGAVSPGADLGANERSANPDGFEMTSNPFGVTLGADGQVYATDAGGNALYRVERGSGHLALVTVFDGLPGPGPNEARGGRPELDPVPTGVAAAPDGALFVSLQGGAPFPAGASRVVRVTPTGVVTEVAGGLNAAIALAVGPDRLLYVVELGRFNGPTQPFGWQAGSGRVLRLRADGRTEVVADGLDTPGGLAFDRTGNLFVTVNGSTAPEAGPRGQVLRFEAVATAAGPSSQPPVQVPSQLPRAGSAGAPVVPALVGVGLILAGLVVGRGLGGRR